LTPIAVVGSVGGAGITICVNRANWALRSVWHRSGTSITKRTIVEDASGDKASTTVIAKLSVIAVDSSKTRIAVAAKARVRERAIVNRITSIAIILSLDTGTTKVTLAPKTISSSSESR